MENRIPSFKDRISSVNPEYETFKSLKTVQVNMGNLCNLACTHCHVEASIRGTKIMSEAVVRDIASFLSSHPDLILDITGGAPEMNPNFRLLIELTDGVVKRRMLRSNLAIMAEEGFDWLPEYCRDHNLTIIGSLPCYLEDNVDSHRGKGTYRKIISTLKILNKLGYGDSLELDLVYNPAGNYLPGSQEELEKAYKAELFEKYGIIFNNLFTITNAPIGRFKDILSKTGSYADYLLKLSNGFNPDAAESIMCRTLISVDWEGRVYNCDFNQALDMPVTADDGSVVTVADIDTITLKGKKIKLSQHCYCCTAGEGSSCTGALAVGE